MTLDTSVRPAIHLKHDPLAAPELIGAFLLGCEEEGVPVRISIGTGDAESLARSASRASELFIGAGIDASSTIALHEQRLGDRPPLLLHRLTSRDTVRSIGAAAGRLTRGRPIPLSSTTTDNR